MEGIRRTTQVPKKPPSVWRQQHQEFIQVLLPPSIPPSLLHEATMKTSSHLLPPAMFMVLLLQSFVRVPIAPFEITLSIRLPTP